MMANCNHCGTPLRDGAKFCTACGARQDAPAGAAPQPGTGPAPSVPPAPAMPPAPAHAYRAPAAVPPVPVPAPAASGATATAATADRKRKLLIAAIAAVIAIIVLAVTGIVTYRMDLWGSRTVPTIGAAEKAGSADDVAAQLEGQGFHTTRKREFSASDKGAYLRIEGAKEGERVARSQQLTVVESLGPGVPDGTVGLTQDKAVERVGGMGVPVSVTEVVSDHPGEVIDTKPAQGEALADKDRSGGIRLAVGVKKDGIPVEIAGLDKDKAKQRLESDGFDVTVMPVAASKDMVGNVVSADPAIGSVTSGDDVTLYVGADAKALKDAMVTHTKTDEAGDYYTYEQLRPLVGRWCTDDGNCIDLEPFSRYGDAVDKDGVVHGLSMDGRTDYASPIGLTVCPYAQTYGECNPKKPRFAFEQLLLSGDSGAFELFENTALPYCGTTVIGVGGYCDGGVLRTDDWSSSGKNTGTEYRMNEFLLVVPVGADIGQVEDSGYFKDKPGAKAPDATRPYILKRDPSLYDKTSVSADGNNIHNPFLPKLTKDQTGETVKFAPSPSADVAYYKVEDTLDWSKLDAKQVCPDGGCTTKDTADTKESDSNESGDKQSDGKQSDSKQPDAKNADGMSVAEIRSSLVHGDFQPIAGEYCNHDGGCITIGDDGKATHNSKVERPFTYDDGPSMLQVPDTANQRWSGTLDPSVGIEMDGPDSDIRCGDESGSEACSSHSSAETFIPVSMIYFPKGTDPDKLPQFDAEGMNTPEGVSNTPPSKDHAYIQLMRDRNHTQVLDGTVYYLQD
ncbi:PASTA domain-containing protein [uncultured Bifidobacterium sp.]|uniref:PASTA domain-containing protein n=1 Tax=uncultured Bifidobacterium sp. TaxID=165187 RepID=UPI00258EDA4A|nr:PASTA domain-containing protein [uncultured Bifidobacterium sp.]